MKTYELTIFFVVLALAFFALAQEASSRNCDIRMDIESGPDLAVTIPCMSKADLTSVLGSFFGRGDDNASRTIREKMGEAKQITLTLTTK